MMDKQSGIKIIKRNERQAKVRSEINAQPQPPMHAIVTTVTAWVNEFQQRREEEYRQALRTLFAD